MTHLTTCPVKSLPPGKLRSYLEQYVPYRDGMVQRHTALELAAYQMRQLAKADPNSLAVKAARERAMQDRRFLLGVPGTAPMRRPDEPPDVIHLSQEPPTIDGTLAETSEPINRAVPGL